LLVQLGHRRSRQHLGPHDYITFPTTSLRKRSTSPSIAMPVGTT
jgi:hypothetical protein